MPRRTKLDETTTSAPDNAQIEYTSGHKSISPGDWTNLSNDLYQSLNACLGTRGALEQNLKDWNDLYEMRVDQTNWPWVGASNVFIPLIPSQLDTAVAYISGKVFVPRFYVVAGNTPDAQEVAHKVENYYNAELTRQRGPTTWYDTYLTWLHLGFRDGTSILEVMWRRTTKKKKVVTFEPEMDGDTPVIDMKTGRTKTNRRITEVEVVEYDDVDIKPVLLRDFLLIPDEAESIEAAVGVMRALWLYESDCAAMVKDGVLEADEVELALSYVPTGTSDFASDRQGNYDRTMGDQLVLGQGQGSQVSKFFANRGPIKVWRIHSRQYDMNGDGVPEENIFYLHELSQRLLGWTDYKYISPFRPYFSFSPMARPYRFYGFSMCERLAPIQTELNGMYNSRNNLIDLMLNPPLLYENGEELDDQSQTWGPGARWCVSRVGTNPAVSFMQFPQVPLASFQNEQLLNTYVDKLTGVGAPAMGAQGPGRRTATETKMQMSSTTTRNDLVAMRLRTVCRAVFNFIHQLKLQYTQDDPEYMQAGQILTLPRELLAKDYRLDIAGSADPLDSDTRRNQDLALFQLLMQVPYIQGDQVKQFQAVKMIVESWNKPNSEELIGTQEQATQRQQQAQQMQQMQMGMEAKERMHNLDVAQKTGTPVQQKPPLVAPQGQKHPK